MDQKLYLDSSQPAYLVAIHNHQLNQKSVINYIYVSKDQALDKAKDIINQQQQNNLNTSIVTLDHSGYLLVQPNGNTLFTVKLLTIDLKL